MGGIFLGNTLLTHSSIENIVQDNDFYIKADGNNINWVDKEFCTLNISEPTNFTLNDMLVAKQEYRDIILQIDNLDTNGVKITNYLVLESFNTSNLINRFVNDNFIATINNNATITIQQNIKMTSVTEINKGLEQKFWRGTKEEYKSLDIKNEDTMYIVTDEEGESVTFAGQPDWNQNDPEDLAYIKNRPFYTNSVINELIADNINVNMIDYGNFSINADTLSVQLVEHSDYLVTWNGVDYLTTCYTLDNAPLIGNAGFLGGPVTDEPFLIVNIDDQDYATIIGNLGIGTVTLSFGAYTTFIEKIPEKYLPKLVGKNVTDEEFIVNEESMIAATGAEIFNDYYKNKAIGEYSHAEGCLTEAIGNYSHAEGFYTTARGDLSHAEGDTTIANGKWSHSEGQHTVASGEASHAEGWFTIAEGINQHVQGQYNIKDSTLAHIVGNGSGHDDENRSNAHTLDWSGNAWFAGDVYVGSTSGTNKDEGSKKLASEEYADTKMNKENPVGTGSFSLNRLENSTIGNDSFATGYQTTASAAYSHAEGFLSIAKGLASHAEGYTHAKGDYSHAEGYESVASGDYSHAEGYNAKAYGDYSHAEGSYTLTNNIYSHAEGYYSEATGNASHAEGDNSVASGKCSHAEGKSSEASGSNSHAEGRSTLAGGISSHAEGHHSEATDSYSHAEGHYSIADGDTTHAEGDSTEAHGAMSHSEGWGSIANGNYSHAEGFFTIADGECQHVQGSYNIEDNDDEYLHIVGNGTGDDRSNAHTIDWQGNAWFAGDVYVGSTSGTNKDEGSKKLGTCPFMTQITLLTSGWNETNLTQSVMVKGISSNENKQLIQCAPTGLSMNAAVDAGIYCSGQAENTLIFTCTTIPTENAVFNITWQDAIWIEPVNLITFYYNGTYIDQHGNPYDVSLTLYAEEGMTWHDWIHSPYSTDNFSCDNDGSDVSVSYEFTEVPYAAYGPVWYEGEEVTCAAPIVANYEYGCLISDEGIF